MAITINLLDENGRYIPETNQYETYEGKYVFRKGMTGEQLKKIYDSVQSTFKILSDDFEKTNKKLEDFIDFRCEQIDKTNQKVDKFILKTDKKIQKIWDTMKSNDGVTSHNFNHICEQIDKINQKFDEFVKQTNEKVTKMEKREKKLCKFVHIDILNKKFDEFVKQTNEKITKMEKTGKKMSERKQFENLEQKFKEFIDFQCNQIDKINNQIDEIKQKNNTLQTEILLARTKINLMQKSKIDEKQLQNQIEYVKKLVKKHDSEQIFHQIFMVEEKINNIIKKLKQRDIIVDNTVLLPSIPI